LLLTGEHSALPSSFPPFPNSKYGESVDTRKWRALLGLSPFLLVAGENAIGHVSAVLRRPRGPLAGANSLFFPP